jgi:hypothetical protein
MKKTLTLACLAATLALGLGAGPAAANRVDGGQAVDSCTRMSELCWWIGRAPYYF